jgi:DnaJ-class molecular chaperone
MPKSSGEKKKPCKNCEGKGTLKKGDKIVRCQRCGGTGIKPSQLNQVCRHFTERFQKSRPFQARSNILHRKNSRPFQSFRQRAAA